MSFYDDASLIMYPSGVKSGKIYSQKPTNGTGDLTFTRASTATRVNADGLIEDVASGVPRIDYSGGGCGKLLLEPQRTNLLLRSEEFDNGSWTKSGCTVSANDTTSPDGTTTADKIVASVGSSYKIVFQVVSSTNGAPHTVSAFYKADEYNYAFLRVGGQTPAPYVIYNLSNQSVVSTANATSTSIEDYGDGWYKISMTYTTNNTTNAPNVVFLPSSGYTLDGANQPSYNGDGISGGYVWGAQLEEGSYPTSYIPTSGAAATRVTDNATNTALKSSGILSPTGNTFFFDINLIDSPADINSPHFGFDDGSFNNVVFLYNPSVGNPYVVGRLAGSGLSGGAGNTEILSNTRNKIAVRWNASGFTMYLNGVSVYTATSAYNNTIDRFRFWSRVLQPFDLNGLGIYSGNLTNDDLERLTTL